MAFERQTKSDLIFVDWGELGEGHTPEENVVVEEGTALIGTIERIGESDKGYRYYYILKDAKIVDAKGKEKRKVETDVYLKGNASINRQCLEDDSDDFIPVKEGDLVQFKYMGTYTTKKGGTGYGIEVSVDR